MSTFEIVLINPNTIQALNPYSSEFDEELKKCTKVVSVTNETFMEIVCKHLKMNEAENDFMGDTELCYETPDRKIYEFCHIDIVENQIESRGKNVLASQLCYLHKEIDGPVALFGYKVSVGTGTPTSISIGYNEIKEIMINKFMHTGVYVHSSGNMAEFTFHNDMNVLNQENQKPDLIPRLRDISMLLKTGSFFEFSVYKYNLIIVTPLIECNDNDKGNFDSYPTSKVISLFLNKMIAKGDFIVLCKVAQNDYINFSINELKQMVYLYDQKDLKSKDTVNEKVGEIKVVKNKHMILYNKFKEYRNGKKISELMKDNVFNSFVNETFEKFKENIKYKDTIFNVQVFKELKDKAEKKMKKKEMLDKLLKDKGLTVSEEIDIDVAEDALPDLEDKNSD